MFSRLDRRSLPVAGFLIVGALTAMTALASAAEPQAGALASCAQDLAKWCHGVEAGGGKILGAMDETGGHSMEPMMIPGIGLWISFQDTEDNRVSLLQPGAGM